MSLVVVTARVHADNVDAVAAEARKTVAAIAAAAPDVGFAICKAPDGVTFIALLDAPVGANPLLAIPAFVDFHEGISAWGTEPPASEQWEVLGAYGLLERATGARRRNDSRHTPHDTPTKEQPV